MSLVKLRLDKRQMFPDVLAAIHARFPGIEIEDREPA